MTENRDFPVVGIGASAGGLEAIKGLLAEVPVDGEEEDVAFVIIQHMDPDHESVMASLLEKVTAMEIREIEDGMEIEPNHVYLNPPRKKIAISGGKFQTYEFNTGEVQKLPIDHFFRSLSEQLEEKAICVVLSGSNADGSTGLKAVKSSGGMTLAQKESEAQYREMPRSAIDTGFVDYVLPVKEMADKIFDYARHPYIDTPAEASAKDERFEKVLPKIFALIRKEMGHDFVNYKTTTIRRRIERRMAVHQIESIGDYHQFLRGSRTEVEELFKDLLITVTNFFREPETFDFLKAEVLPDLIEKKPTDSSLRIWVPGCSTGEEAYTIGMLLTEIMEELGARLDPQIFATDLDGGSIEIARKGVYPESIAADLSEERLNRFFEKKGEKYKISDRIRKMVVFAEHDLIEDPPLSGLDLISCRNVLIYMNRELHEKVIPTFHYALNQDGILLLGSSESTGEFTDLFRAMDKKKSIYRRKETPGRTRDGHWEFPFSEGGTSRTKDPETEEKKTPEVRQLAERTILKRYSDPGVLIDENYDIHYFHGNTERYLTPPEGKPNMNILDMARGKLRYKLTGAISEASKGDKPATREDLKLEYNGEEGLIDLIVEPIDRSPDEEDLYLVVFEEASSAVEPTKNEDSEKGGSRGEIGAADRRLEALEKELKSTKESLRATIEELETSNEELKSRNEELQATNEELRSTNEELQTAREEAQSSNEELTSVNQELKEKIDQLSQTRDDMKNLLDSTEIAILFLDTDLCLRRFTPEATELFNLIESDLGRPLTDISSRLDDENLIEDMNGVLDTLQEVNREVTTEDGDWYEVEIMPYRTTENVVDGLVVTFKDITEMKRIEEKLKESEKKYHSLFNSIRDAILVADTDRNIINCNPAFTELFGYELDEIKGMKTKYVYHDQEEYEEMGEEIEKNVDDPNFFYTIHYKKKNGEVFPGETNVFYLRDEEGEVIGFIGLIRDVTER